MVGTTSSLQTSLAIKKYCNDGAPKNLPLLTNVSKIPDYYQTQRSKLHIMQTAVLSTMLILVALQARLLHATGQAPNRAYDGATAAPASTPPASKATLHGGQRRCTYAYSRLGLPFPTKPDDCAEPPTMLVGGVRKRDLLACVSDLRAERQRIRFDADEASVLAVCHHGGGRRDVRLAWAASPRRRPERVVVRGEDVADALYDVVRRCSHRTLTLGLGRVRGVPVWVVAGKMEAWGEGWKGVAWDMVLDEVRVPVVEVSEG
jgi:hypothetical protein